MKKLSIQAAAILIGLGANAGTLYCDHFTRVETKSLEVHFADDLQQIQAAFDHSGDPAPDRTYSGLMNREQSSAETLVYDLQADGADAGQLTVKKTAVSFPKPDCPRCFVAPNYRYSASLQTASAHHHFGFCSGQPF